MLLNPLKKIEYGTSPTDHSPNSQSAGKTPSVSHLCHHTEMPWRAPICTYPGGQPYSLWGHFLHPSPATSQPQQASLLWPGPSITIPSCFRGPWRHSPHLHLSEQEKVSEDPRGTAPTCSGWRKSPKIQSAGKTTVARPLLHQPQQQQRPLTGAGPYCNNWRKN